MDTQSYLDMTAFEQVACPDMMYPIPDHVAESFEAPLSDLVQGFMACWPQAYDSVIMNSITQDSPVSSSPYSYEEGPTSTVALYSHHIATEGQQLLPKKMRTSQTTREAISPVVSSPTVAQAPVSSKFSSRRRGRRAPQTNRDDSEGECDGENHHLRAETNEELRRLRSKLATQKSQKKRKRFIEEMEREEKKLASQRNYLRGEVDTLKSEIMNLKHEILLHADCGFDLIDAYLAAQQGNSE